MGEEPKSIFADLPDEGEKEEEPVEETKAEVPTEQSKAKELALALKEERRKRKEESDARKEAEEKLAAQQQSTEDKEVVVPPVMDEDKMREIARKELQEKEEKEYQDGLVLEIKRRARSRQEAEAIYDMAKQLPRNGAPALDASLAVEYFDTRRKRTEDFNIPSPMSGGFPASGRAQTPGGLSESALELSHKLGLSDEDIKKYSSDISI